MSGLLLARRLPTVAWTEMAVSGAERPAFTSFLSLVYDPVSQRVLTYAKRHDVSTIYGKDFFAYNTSANTWARLGGTGTSAACNDGSASDVLPWPPDRHIVQHMAVDNSRNVLWIASGVACNTRSNDLWKYALNATPTSNTMTAVDITASVPTVNDSGVLIYSPDDDVLVLLGSPGTGGAWELWVYGPTSGSLSAAQLAAGCVLPNKWKKLQPAGMPTAITNPTDLGWPYFPSAIYDTNLDKILIFAGGTADYRGGVKAIYEYAIPTQTWSTRSFTGLSGTEQGQLPEQPIARIPTGTWAGKYIYQQTKHSDDGDTAAQSYLFDPASNTFTAISSTGTGPSTFHYMTWDASQSKLVSWAYDPDGTLQIWHGVVT